MSNACVQQVVDDQGSEEFVEFIDHWDDLIYECEFRFLNLFDGGDERLSKCKLL